MSVVDQYSDPAFGTLFNQVTRMPNLEGFVKEAEINASDLEGLPPSAFAWPEERKFPLHSKEQAALSYAYFKAASERMPAHVETNLKRALTIYEVPTDVFEEKVAEETKIAAEDYLVPDLHLFYVKSASAVERAQVRLVNEIQKLDLEHRAVACANLVKKAQEYNVKLHPEVEKLAGFVISSTKTVKDWLGARAHALSPDAQMYKSAYEKLAEEVAKQPEFVKNRSDLLKLANAIGTLDEKSGLDKHYDRKLPDALRTVFNTEKRASEMVDLGGGKMVSVSKLASLPVSIWDDLGGSELSNEIAPGGVVDRAKIGTVVDTLPLDLKVVLRAYC